VCCASEALVPSAVVSQAPDAPQTRSATSDGSAANWVGRRGTNAAAEGAQVQDARTQRTWHHVRAPRDLFRAPRSSMAFTMSSLTVGVRVAAPAGRSSANGRACAPASVVRASPLRSSAAAFVAAAPLRRSASAASRRAAPRAATVSTTAAFKVRAECLPEVR